MATVPLEEFARQLFASAASPERVAAAAAGVIENPMAVGPMRVGPGGIARASAICYIGEIRGRAASDDTWDIVLQLPVRVGATVLVRPQRFKFFLEIDVEARLRFVPTSGFTVTTEVDHIRDSDVTIKVDALHLPAKLVALGYSIEKEVVRRAIEHANEYLERPEIREVLTVDVAEVIDRAWDLGAVLPLSEGAPVAPEEFDAPELDDDDDLSTEDSNAPVLAHPQPTLPMELPRDTGNT